MIDTILFLLLLLLLLLIIIILSLISYYIPLLFAFVVGGLGFEFCVFVAG